MRVRDKIRNCVAFIGAMDRDRFVPYGTGFFVVKNTSGKMFQQLVTARHVLEDVNREQIHIRVNLKDGGSGIFYSNVKDWFFHPDNTQNVDVAVLPSHASTKKFDIVHVSIDRELATKKVIQKHSIGIGDDVFITGLFTQHVGEVRNIPIVRVGNIAAMPEEPVWTGSAYMDAYLIEARSIGGLSGSPVFVHMAPLRVIEGIVQPTQGLTHYLLGVMHGHFVIENPEDAVMEGDESAGKINTGIGVVVPGSKIAEVINQPLLEKRRREIVENLKKDSGVVLDVTLRPSKSLPTKADNPQHK